MPVRLPGPSLKSVPLWVWLTLAVAFTAPWYLAYIALVLKLAGVVSFWMPATN